jgi:hypothetical protein
VIATALLGHQGGWDEIVLVTGPMLLVAGLLWTAKRRVSRSDPSAGQTADAASDDAVSR